MRNDIVNSFSYTRTGRQVSVIRTLVPTAHSETFFETVTWFFCFSRSSGLFRIKALNSACSFSFANSISSLHSLDVSSSHLSGFTFLKHTDARMRWFAFNVIRQSM